MGISLNKFKPLMKKFCKIFSVLFLICFLLAINNVNANATTTNGENKSSSNEQFILTLQEKDGSEEKIYGSEINFKITSETPRVVSYDDNLLKIRIDKLACFDSTKVIQTQNAIMQLTDKGYEVKKEVYGNSVSKDILYNNIVQAILKGYEIINLENSNCYEKPGIVVNSPSVSYAVEALNKYILSKITYNIEGITKVVDKSIIKDWISVDSNFQVTINESRIRSYVQELANTYNSSLGNSIKVSGGYSGNNHSWSINVDEETTALINNIKNGQTISKGPIYSKREDLWHFNNVYDTYVEIDISKQHLWFYKDGYLVVDGDVVTGNESNGNSTPSGVYKLRAKQKDTVLIGADYAAPVSFWMPFVNQIGIHDASWRNEFGGDIYKTDGSHGCINSPYYVAKAVYDNISVGTFVICHE